MINFVCTVCNTTFVYLHSRKELTRNHFNCLNPKCGGPLKYEDNYASAAPRTEATFVKPQNTEESKKAFEEFKSKKKSVDDIVRHIIIEWRSPMFKSIQKNCNWVIHTYPTANEVAYIAEERYSVSSSTARKEVSKVSEKMGSRECNVTGKTCAMRLVRDW